jgi:hypothetical protein
VFVNRQFIAADPVRKELLATALTAIGTGQVVQALVDDGAPEFGTLFALYVTSEVPQPPAPPLPPPPASRWVSLGGESLGGPAAVLQTGGRLVVFGRGTNNRIWHIWQTSRNGDWSGWAEVPGGELTSDPAAALNADGGLVVFARGTDNAIWHAWQDAADGSWA